MLLIVGLLLMVLIFCMGYMVSIVCRIICICIEHQALVKKIPEADACPVVTTVPNTQEVNTEGIIVTEDIVIIAYCE